MPPPPGSLPGTEVGMSSSHLLRVHEDTSEPLQAHGPHQLVGVVQAQAQEVAHRFPRHVLGEIVTVEKLSRFLPSDHHFGYQGKPAYSTA